MWVVAALATMACCWAPTTETQISQFTPPVPLTLSDVLSIRATGISRAAPSTAINFTRSSFISVVPESFAVNVTVASSPLPSAPRGVGRRVTHLMRSRPAASWALQVASRPLDPRKAPLWAPPP
jgi:hypothetical protein